MIFRSMRSAAVLMVMIVSSGCAATPPSLQVAAPGTVPVPARMQSLPTLQGSYYAVKPGETLWRIARSYGLTPQALAAANHLPANGVVAVGQQLYIPLPPETDHFLWPLRGSANLSHSGGIDIIGPGTFVRASRSGRVAVATSHLSGWGNTVVMDHPDGSVSVYAGMDQLVVAPGMLLRQGMPVGMGGARPVHFEIRIGVKPANTLGLLPRE